jgi:hypothetical protein
MESAETGPLLRLRDMRQRRAASTGELDHNQLEELNNHPRTVSYYRSRDVFEMKYPGRKGHLSKLRIF